MDAINKYALRLLTFNDGAPLYLRFAWMMHNIPLSFKQIQSELELASEPVNAASDKVARFSGRHLIERRFQGGAYFSDAGHSALGGLTEFYHHLRETIEIQ